MLRITLIILILRIIILILRIIVIYVIFIIISRIMQSYYNLSNKHACSMIQSVVMEQR